MMMANFVPAGYEDEYSDDSDDFGLSYNPDKKSTDKCYTVPYVEKSNPDWRYSDDWNVPAVEPNKDWNTSAVKPKELRTGNGWNTEQLYENNKSPYQVGPVDDWNIPEAGPNKDWSPSAVKPKESRTGDDWSNEPLYENNEIHYQVDLSSKLQNNIQLPIDDLRMAILNGDLKTTQQYIESGVDVDVILKSNWTPLMYASNAAKPEIVKYLLEKKADMNYDKADMFTPLMAACMSTVKEENNIVQCIEHLVEYGAKLNYMDRFHSTPLMHAANSGHLLVLQKLLESGADPNLVDTHGWTALFYAANNGYMSMVTELKKVGANMKHRDNRKDSAADVAYSRAFDQIAAYLDDIYKPNDDDDSASEQIVDDPCIEKSAMPERYGELELFLHGLELSSYIDLFHKHQVTFHQLLQLTNDDLEKMGVMKVGARKKIVDAISAVHKKDWQTTSLMKFQYDTSIKCSDAAAMLANISRHTLYITSTIGYIGDQVRLHPGIITETYDKKLLKQLHHYMNEAQENTSKLLTQLEKFDQEVKMLTEKKDLEPIGLITESSIVKKKSFPVLIIQTPHKLLMTMTVGVMGLMIWKKNILIDKFSLFSSQFQQWVNLK